MKKYSFSLFNIFEETSKEVEILRSSVDGLIGSLAVSAYFTDRPIYSIWLMLGGFVVNKLIGCIKIEKI